MIERTEGLATAAEGKPNRSDWCRRFEKVRHLVHVGSPDSRSRQMEPLSEAQVEQRLFLPCGRKKRQPVHRLLRLRVETRRKRSSPGKQPLLSTSRFFFADEAHVLKEQAPEGNRAMGQVSGCPAVADFSKTWLSLNCCHDVFAVHLVTRSIM